MLNILILMTILNIGIGKLYNPSEKIELFVNPENLHLRDQYGRERIFHGTNIVYKDVPYHPSIDIFDYQHSFVDEDMELLKSMGYNSIRLSVPWAAVEPIRGQYNETYLNIIQDIIQKAGSQYGIYTLIDFHQDAWNAKFCGNGAPDWAIPKKSLGSFPIPIILHKVPSDLSTGHPTRQTCDSINNNNWPAYYLSYATSTAIGAVYDNEDDLRNSFVAYWVKVATKFANNDYVIGYELMNEPFAGNIYTNPLLLVPGVADRLKLQPLYDQVTNEIRKVDKNKLILFQGVTWEVVLPIGEKYGFQHSPGDQIYNNKSVLSFHCSVLPNWTPDLKYFQWKKNEMKRINVGGWVTETGLGTLDLQDFHQLSWMHWDYKGFANLTWDNPGIFHEPCAVPNSLEACIDKDQARGYSRTYAKAVSGITNSFTFNQNTLEAQLNYQINPDIQEPTVIFASQTWNYVNGFDVLISPSEKAIFSIENNDHIIITHVAPIKAINITITIKPKSAFLQKK